MPKLPFITAALAAALVCSIKVNHTKRKKYETILDDLWTIFERDTTKYVNEIESLGNDVNHNAHVVNYLYRIMRANGIELDEFDLIALNNPME